MTVSRRSMLSLATAAVMPSLLPRHAGAAGDAGAVIAVSGESRAERGGRSLDLAVGDAVLVGDAVSTAAEARLAMRFGAARILLGSRTRLRIDRFLVSQGGVFALGDGAMLFDGPQGGPGGEVTTPFGRLAVRGTRFFAGPSDSRFSVFVARGAVRVSAGDAIVDLGPGEGTDFEAAGAPPTPPRRWGEARIRTALALVE